MTDKQIGVLVIAPLIIATGVALWRQGAMGGKALSVAALGTTAGAAFVVLMQ